jgi:hypothetical protein
MDYLWCDASGEPLPFQDHATIQEMMRTATVISCEKVGRGVAGTEKCVLEHEGLRFHAAFRDVDDRRTARGYSAASRAKDYRDAATFENAAYELSELLGVCRVPPAVNRSIDEDDGTMQIWMEHTRPEDELIQADELRPPDIDRWLQQKQIMYVFDSLIANSDRNQGNLLIDRHWNIWLIDHTRAFRQTSRLLYGDGLEQCERRLWQRLQEVDKATLRALLEPYLERRELAKLVVRHRQLVRHIKKLIKKRGEEAVLFDLRPSNGEVVD